MKWIAPHGATTATERYRNAEPLVAGSNPDAAFFNDVLDELLAVITTADMEPTDQNMHQIADAIVYLANRAATSGVVKGSFWFGKTTANFTVPAPTEIGQTYIDFTNLKMYISNNGTSWTENGTFVKPEGIDFTILITSKFWDIAEQTDQQGGDAIYSHSTDSWTYWPRIVNLDNVANLDLSNLSSTGKNIGLWCDNAANIIAEIPQDINLTLSSGVLTLKAGSKVYVPNGAGVFDAVTIPSDKSATFNDDGTYIADYDGGGVSYQSLSAVKSGASLPANYSGLFYNTTDNTIAWYNNGTVVQTGYSFPICIFTVSGGQISSIDQVFNGFGYIGRQVFALPGVKALCVNGRNADNTLKSTLVTLTSVKVTAGYTCPFLIDLNGNFFPAFSATYAEQETQPSFQNGYWYNPVTNRINIIQNGVASQTTGAAVAMYCKLLNTNFVEYVKPVLPFRAVDYNDFQKTNEVVATKADDDSVMHLADPETITGYKAFSGGVALGANATAITPSTDDNSSLVATTAWVRKNGAFLVYSQEPTAENNYTWVRKYSDGWVEQGGRATGDCTVNLPVTMADTGYTLVITKNDGNSGAQGIGTSAITTTSFYANRYSSGLGLFSWQVSGIAAEYPEYRYLTPGTYTQELAAGTYVFDLSAGGGGGAVALSTATYTDGEAGATGGSGAYGSFELTLDSADTVTIVVGAGGTGATRNDGTASSTSGGSTTISTTNLGTIVTLTGGGRAQAYAAGTHDTVDAGAGGTVSTTLTTHSLSNGSNGSATTKSGSRSAGNKTNPEPFNTYGYGGGFSYYHGPGTSTKSASNGGAGYVHIQQIA